MIRDIGARTHTHIPTNDAEGIHKALTHPPSNPTHAVHTDTPYTDTTQYTVHKTYDAEHEWLTQ
jgi:hypothetical protein